MEPRVSEAAGHPKVFFTMAVDHRFRRDGEWVSKPSFFAVTAWRDLATQVERVLSKGMRVVVTGRLESWRPDGEERDQVQVIADEIAASIRWLESVTPLPRGEGGSRSSADSGRDREPAGSPW